MYVFHVTNPNISYFSRLFLRGGLQIPNSTPADCKSAGTETDCKSRVPRPAVPRQTNLEILNLEI